MPPIPALKRRAILECPYGTNRPSTVTRTVDMPISMLRQKLGEDSRHPALLVTVHGVGYMMTSLAQTV